MIPRGKNLYLCDPLTNLRTILNGVRYDEVDLQVHVKDFYVLTFIVDEYIIDRNGEKVKSSGYDQLGVYMNIFLDNIGYFQMQEPTVSSDGNSEYKTVTAYSINKEWEQRSFLSFKCNAGDEDSFEQLAENNLNEVGMAIDFVQFYRPDKPDLSMIHLMLSKLPGWSVSDTDIDFSLWTKKLLIEEENISVYALATSVIAPRLECLFVFDIMNRTFKVISKENLDSDAYDTNVFIGYRSLANAVEISVNEDSVYTVFNVQGDEELTFADINYGDTSVYDYSYFLNSNYFDNYSTLKSKIDSWQKFRDEHREEYVNYSKEFAKTNDELYQLVYKVPVQGIEWDKWDGQDRKMLDENLKYYNNLLLNLQISVDPHPSYTSNNEYIVWKKADGTVDHELYLSRLKDKENGYGGYQTYSIIIRYIIPNIETAIENLSITTESEKKDYNKEYETNWELYGIKLLEGKRDNYRNQLEGLQKFSKSWDEMTEDERKNFVNEEEYNKLGHNTYVEVKGYLGDEHTPGSIIYYIATQYVEKERLEAQLDSIKNSQLVLRKSANLDRFLTKDEYIQIGTISHDTDYVNTNIFTTSIDTTDSKYEIEQELYDDATSKLSEVSQPQYSISVEMDNLLGLPEFTYLLDDFKLLNFFRVGIRDDYSVKLRLIGYGYNPCSVTSNFTIEFSSMITSRSGRSDLTDLLNSDNYRGSRNSLSLGSGNTKQDQQYLDALASKLLQNGLFTNGIGGAININADSIVARSAKFNELEATKANITYLESNYAHLQNGYINEALIADESISSSKIKDLTASKITSGVLDATNITVTNLDASNIKVGTINGVAIGNETISLNKLSEKVPTKAELDRFEAEIQSQMDGTVETWISDTIPTMFNYPTNQWEDDNAKLRHIGDVLYVTNVGNRAEGFCYRFAQNNDKTLEWIEIKDKNVLSLLQGLLDADGDLSGLSSYSAATSKWITETDEGKRTVYASTSTVDTKIGEYIQSDVFNERIESAFENSSTIKTISEKVDGTAEGFVKETNIIANTAKQTADANSSIITGLQETVGDETKGLVSRASKIEQDLANINLSVSSIGVRNLVKHSDSNKDYDYTKNYPSDGDEIPTLPPSPSSQGGDGCIAVYELTEIPREDYDLTLTIWGSLTEGKTFKICGSGGNVEQVKLKKVDVGKYRATFKWQPWDNVHGSANKIYIYITDAEIDNE